MTSNKVLDVLKQALLLEKKGFALYSEVAKHTQSGAAREFFQMMANEEKLHVAWVEKQFALAAKGRAFAEIEMEDSPTADAVLTAKLKEEISAAGYEAAAISAAIALEENAIRIYSERAKETQDKEEKRMYETLVEFERQHLVMLLKINSEITQSVWFDNQFWPF